MARWHNMGAKIGQRLFTRHNKDALLKKIEERNRHFGETADEDE